MIKPVISPNEASTMFMFVANEHRNNPSAETMPPVNVVNLCPHLWISRLATGPVLFKIFYF